MASSLWSLGTPGRRASLGRKIALVLALLAALAGIGTAVVIFEGGRSIDTILTLLYVNIAILVALIAVVGFKLGQLWRERRSGDQARSLHTRLAAMFGLVAIVPSLLVAALAAAFLNYGFQGWFSDRIRTAVEQSNSVAAAYLDEHIETIRSVAFAVATDMDNNAAYLVGADRARLSQFLNAQVDVRGLAEAMILDGTGRVVARSAFSQSFDFDSIPDRALAEARETGDIVVATGRGDDRVRALVRLGRFVDSYLVVGRLIDANVLDRVQKVEGAVRQYSTLESEREGLQVTFTTIFIIVSLLTLFGAIWFGLIVSDRLAEPIRSMADAAARMGGGDLKTRVEASGSGELLTLGTAFNRMAGQIEEQQRGLLDANRALDERRRFIETVLGGVTAGVIGLDGAGRIGIANRSASTLLERDLDAETDRLLAEVAPEMAGLLAAAAERPERTREEEIRLERGAAAKSLLVRIVGERLNDAVIGYVVTFDDITELQSAQRKAAWADVARRIAHEIKNPLTPIQLSAERLRRRFAAQIETDPETFQQCLDTIVRQVGEIGAMVDEFSAFARMPQAKVAPHDLAAICRDAVFMEGNRGDGVTVTAHGVDEPVVCVVDRDQIGRALVNLIKNAVESVEAAREQGVERATDGGVTLTLDHDAGAAADNGDSDGPWVRLVVADAGLGLPAHDRDRLVEPYVTTREKGTGLGLAIVKKIAEDHGGRLELGDAEGGGARIVLAFPLRRAEAGGEGDVEDGRTQSGEDRALAAASRIG
jgi:two-component system nitrogen regulation sensor histidine kinase NtrY